MGLFNKKKTEEAKDQVVKSEDVKVEKKTAKKEEVKKVEKKKSAKKIAQSRKISSRGKKEYLKKTHGDAYKHLIRPLISEKIATLGMHNQYGFEVSTRSNKVEVKKAIKSLYGVEPVKVNIIQVRGKKVRRGRKFGMTKSWKKAIITLKQGDKIEVYEGV